MTDPEFPFLKLPYLMQRLVLRIMTVNELIRYSLLSKNAKALIQSLPNRVKYLEFSIEVPKIYISCNLDDMKTIEMHLPEVERDERVELPEKPEEVNDREQKLVKPEFSLRDWVIHISDVLRCKKIKLFFRRGSHYYYMQSIRQLFDGMDIIGVGVQQTEYIHGREVFNEFPNVRELTFGDPSLDRHDSSMMVALVSRDLDFFRCERHLDIWWLLKMNCKIIEVFTAGFSLGDVNLFIRSWSSLSTNHNLEIFSVMFKEFNERHDLEIIFGGVQYTVVPKESYREFRAPYRSHLWEFVNAVLGQFEIQRNDGVKAWIQVDRFVRATRFKLLVGE